MLAACPWLRLHSLPGLCQLLRRLGIRWKRAREHIHSPDPNYVAKLHDIRLLIRRLPQEAEQLVFLVEDEFTLYRQPGLAQAYEQVGKAQAQAERSPQQNYTWRIAASLNVWTGQVIYHQAWAMDVTRLIRFYRKLSQAYPAQQIALAQDNWSVHYHPDVLAALQPQAFPYGTHAPATWQRNPKRPVEQLQLPIQLFFFPTYASWTNPIEKLWRWLKQEVLHLHRYAEDWAVLKATVFAFLDQFSQGSKELLRYVGLEDPYRLYEPLFLPDLLNQICGI